MNALVVYDSQYGNTERIAQAIAEALRASGQARTARVSALGPDELQGIDMLIIGSPTQGWRPTAPIQSFVKSLPVGRMRDVDVTCFDTRFQKPRWMTGSAAIIIGKRLHELGIPLIAPPESFFVNANEGPLHTGELERAADWARTLINLTQLHPVGSR